MSVFDKKKLPLIVAGLVVYLLSAGAVFAALSYFQPALPTASSKKSTSPSGKFQSPVDKYANLPRTEPCPLNGALYPKPQRDAWEKRRPLGVMIENSKPARPQSGVSFADVVYEAVAEGGITRFLTVFYCQDAEVVGPIRSARTYFLDWISEYGSSPLYAHQGGANQPGPADALGQITQFGWRGYNDLDQFGVGFPTYALDIDRLGRDTAIEHSMYTSTDKLWAFASSKRKLTNVEIDDVTGKELAWNKSFVGWSFKDDAPLASRPSSLAATFNFSGINASYLGDYSVSWQYDRDSNSFLRTNGGAPFTDLDTGQQILAKNVIIQFETMTIADDGYDEAGHGSHTLYGTTGTGKAKFLIDGKLVEGTWAKKGRLDRTRFFDAKGVELKLNRGQTWIETLPIGQTVTVQ